MFRQVSEVDIAWTAFDSWSCLIGLSCAFGRCAFHFLDILIFCVDRSMYMFDVEA